MSGAAKTVNSAMSKRLLTIGPNEPLAHAWTIMKEKNIRHLPVVNEMGDVIGILSDRDLQRALSPQYDKDSPREMGFRFDPAFVTKDFMKWPVHAVQADTSLVLVAKSMLIEKVSAFLVQDERAHTVGIITTDDLLRVLIALLEKEPSSARLTLRGLQSDYVLPAGNWV